MSAELSPEQYSSDKSHLDLLPMITLSGREWMPRSFWANSRTRSLNPYLKLKRREQHSHDSFDNEPSLMDDYGTHGLPAEYRLIPA